MKFEIQNLIFRQFLFHVWVVNHYSRKFSSRDFGKSDLWVIRCDWSVISRNDETIEHFNHKLKIKWCKLKIVQVLIIQSKISKAACSIFRRESKGIWMVRILGHLRIFELKKVGHLGFLTRDRYFEEKIRETEWFEFWAISDSHAYAFTWQHLLRWLFGLSRIPPRNGFQAKMFSCPSESFYRWECLYLIFNWKRDSYLYAVSPHHN